ncbi:MAG: lamin tail domain-containing protein, partial [Verrucomicrobiales bacterium]|nr:lamin tail domain-containing protein [Verrucomicrobiales bacterium]
MLLPAGFRYWKSLLCLLVVVLAPGLSGRAHAGSQIVVTEIAPAPPDRLLKWDADRPRLGVGPAWTEPGFDDSGWSKGQGPFGFGYPNIVTDVGASMAGRTPSLYLRCVFAVSPGQPLDDVPLRFLLRYDDGLLATLNGQEIARANLGPAGMFIPARHPSFNASTSAEPVSIDLGPASKFLRPGPNLLTVQVHNTWPAAGALPHDPTLLADIRLVLGDGDSLELVGGTTDWRWFAGASEPSGAFRDPDLIQAHAESSGEAGEFHDWIELHNRGDQEVDLRGWTLSDDPADPAKWSFPTQRLAPGAYLVVFCSGLDRRSPSSGFHHTNFRLNRSGEALTLRRPDGTLAFGFLPSYPPLDPFHSYGIDEATGAWGYFPEPTPGRANQGPLLLGRTEPVTLSPQAGFYDADVNVELHCPTPFARVRYTLDGSEPSPSNGYDYTLPFLVSSNTTVRTRAFRNGWVPSDVATATYLLRLPSALTNMPALVLSGPPSRTFFAPQGLVTVAGGNYVGAFQEEIWSADSPDDYNMYLVSGPAAERPATVELLRPGTAPAGPWSCGLRVSSSLWSTPRMIMPPAGDIVWNHDGLSFRIKPSFGLFFRGEYGLAELDYPLFAGPGGDRFDDLRIRAGKNDWANPFIRDELVRRLYGQMGQPTSRGILVNLFINGQFKSYYNLVERLRTGFLQSRTGGSADWDIVLPIEIAEGDEVRWKEDRAFLSAGSLADDARYREAQRRFDVVNLADYALLNLYSATSDWPENNWVLARERSEGGQWRFLVWDAEATFGYMSPKTVTHDTLSADLLATNAPLTVVAEVFSAFYANPEFRLLFADRVQRHFFGSGALTETNVLREAGVLQQQAEPSVQLVRSEPLKTGYLTFWAGHRPAALLRFLADRGLWPTVTAPHILLPTNFNPALTSTPAELRMLASAPGDMIYYTLDGSDPRAPGGLASGTAYSDSNLVQLPGPVRIQARALRGLEWSPLTTADFRQPPPETLEVTEIHYEPLGSGTIDGRAFEFIELRNRAAHAVSLENVAFTEGIQFAFPAGSTLVPGGYAVLVADSEAFRSRYPDVAIAGVYSGRLDNAGETIGLTHQRTNVLVRLTYNNTAPWPTLAAGQGFSLVPSGMTEVPPSDPRAWRNSSFPHGSPGRADEPPVALPVVINEVFPRPPPGQPWWIELHNPSPRAIDIGYWWLTDDPANPRKYAFPEGTILPPQGFVLVDATEIAALPAVQQLRLSPSGGRLLLFAADSNDLLLGGTSEFNYEPVPERHSYGRTLDDSEWEHIVPLASASPDHENGPPLLPRVAIQEIGVATHPDDLEFIEIANLTDGPVALFDPAHPLRPWRLDGVAFEFPPGFVLAPGERIVICASDPSVFRAQREVPAQVRLLGPWSGTLDSDGENLRLQRPEQLATGELVYHSEDRVRFRTSAPWPPLQATGHSFQRRTPAGLGDAPTQWVAEPATPGRPNGLTASNQTTLRLAPSTLTETIVEGRPVTINVGVDSVSSTTTVQSLALYVNEEVVGTAQGTQATFSWSPEIRHLGPTEWRAVAITDDGAEVATTRRSTRVLASRTSETTLLPTNALWKTFRTAQPVAPAWSGVSFNDAPWLAVPGPVPPAESSTHPDTSTYLRHTIDLPPAAVADVFRLRLQGSPGVQVFLNDHELAVIDAGTEAGVHLNLDSAWLKPGTNVFAARIPPVIPPAAAHPFSLELIGPQTVTEPWILESPTDQAIPAGAPATFDTRIAGSPLVLRWYQSSVSGPTRLLAANTSALTLPAASVDDVGGYFVVASNSLGSVTSTVARLSILPPDSDGDGMPDAWELQYGLDPNRPSDATEDADTDFASNLEEYLSGSDPTRAPDQPAVVLSEIMYRPASANPAHEFVELLNPGTTPVSLDHWQFTRGIRYAFSNLVLEPGGTVVVAADPSAFATVYPNVSPVVGPWQGTLSNSGETLELVDAAGRLADFVHYATEGDWARRRRGPVSVDAQGWEWFAEHDGLGKSLELIQPRLSNDSGQNWDASQVAGGTPGAPNSIARTNIAPLVSGVSQLPPAPLPGSPVRVLATLSDEQNLGLEAHLHFRLHQQIPPPPFETVPMTDDGLHGDGLAGDGIWAADLPPQAVGAVVEYYIAARDGAGNERTWPAPALDESLAPTQVDNALYLVDAPSGPRTRPRFRLIMTETERRAHESADRRSNAAFIAAVIMDGGTDIEVRQRASIRIRGASTRFAIVPNLRLHFPTDDPWHGVDDLNINTFVWAPSQLVGSVLALQSGVPAARARPIDLFLNATNRTAQGAFVQLQVIDDDWARDLFPNDPEGNVYFCRRPVTDLSYLGTNSATYVSFGYSKESNREANDWSDLIRLTDVLNNTADADYARAVREVLDPEAWVRYFAWNSLLGNSETSLGSGVGDDYDLYRGVHDPRFLLVAHDLDSLLSFTVSMPIQTGIFQATAVRSVDRLLKHPEFAPLYYRELDRLMQGPCSPAQVEAVARYWLKDVADAGVIDEMTRYARLRAEAVAAQIPRTLSIVHTLPTALGYPRATEPTVVLSGQANAVTTRSVRINGTETPWIAWQARWTNAAVPLRPGLNRIIVQALDIHQVVTEERTLDIWFDTPVESIISEPELTRDVTWTVAQSPYWVDRTLTVPPGRTLTLQPGTTVYFASNAVLSVLGRLVAEGTADSPIRLSSRPGAPAWGGIGIVNVTNENRLVHVVLDNPGANALRIDFSRAHLEAIDFLTTNTCLFFNNASLVIRNCHFPRMAGGEAIIGYGILAGGELVLDGNRFDGTSGYSDLIDFTGGRRPGPILQAYNNLFADGSDDGLDLDGTDAHIEGNVFLRFRRDAPRDSLASGIATDTSADIVVARNWFIDCDNGVLLKNGARLTSHHNLYLGSLESAIVVGSTNPVVLPAGDVRSAGDIFWDNRTAFDPPAAAAALSLNRHLSVTHSLIDDPLVAGDGNRSGDPLFVSTENDFRLRPGSPALRSGPNGLDMGPHVPPGVSISGEPPPITHRNSAVLTFGGPGITHYQYQLDDGSFGPDILSIDSPLILTNLAAGTHRLAAIGRNSAGVWQSTNAPTRSLAWIVNPALRRLVIHEVLARNNGAFSHHGTTPDAIELHNAGASPIDLSGMRLTDDPARPNRFVFPAGTTLPAGGFLVVLADEPNGTAGYHLGFGLDAAGDLVELYESVDRGGQRLDSVRFGLQVADLSLARNARGDWTLGTPTLGAPNQILPLGDPTRLRLTEWLAVGDTEDFVEIHNPTDLPVALDSLSLTDKPLGWPRRDVFPPLSFLGARAFQRLIADSDNDDRSDHLAFRLDADQGDLAIVTADLAIVDQVAYSQQR